MSSVPFWVLIADERGERDHLVGGLAAHEDLADVVRLATVVGIGLDVDAEQASEAVEVVDVGAAEHGRHRLEDFVDRHADQPRLLAVEVDLDLRVARIERGEQVADLGSLARGLHELAAERRRAAPR